MRGLEWVVGEAERVRDLGESLKERPEKDDLRSGLGKGERRV